MSPDAFGSLHQQVVMPLFTVRDGNFVAIGTGFVFGGDGLMMTASHVVLEAAEAAGLAIRDEPQRLQGGDLYAFYVATRNMALTMSTSWEDCGRFRNSGTIKRFPSSRCASATKIVRVGFARQSPGVEPVFAKDQAIDYAQNRLLAWRDRPS